MFAHYVNDYADQLLGAAYAGNEEVAREAGVQRMVEIQTWRDVDVKWCEMNQTNWNPVKKAREKGGKWWSSLQIPNASLPTDSLEQNWARTTCTGMLSLPFSRTHMIYTCPLLELDQRKFR